MSFILQQWHFHALTTTAQTPSSITSVITACFVVGGLTMGPTCFLSATNWRCRIVFVVPSTALIAGAMLACWESFS